MKKLVPIITLAISQFAYAQKDAVVIPSYYNLSLGSKIYESVAPNSTIENVAKTVGGTTKSIVAEVSDMGDLTPSQKLRVMAHKGIREITYKVFLEKLAIEVAPLNKLKGKIDFTKDGYPNQYSFKKVLKKAPGEDYYLSLRINISESGLGIGGVRGLSIGGKVKPTTFITLQIADSKGKVIQEFEVKEKTDIVVGKTKTTVVNVDTSGGEEPEIVNERLMQVYRDALDVLIQDYLKKNKKQYKA